MNIFIFHGVGGSPQENWFPWLSAELREMGHETIVPLFPTPLFQTLPRWLKVLDKHSDKLDDDAILVGHSLGVSFALNVIERHPVKAAFLTAGFTGKIGHFFDRAMKTFAQRDFDWEKIRGNCPHFSVLNSDNDQYVPFYKAEELAAKLGTEVILVKGGGHLNEGAGFTTFPELLEKMKAVL
jgi:uncharacterized protein